MFVNDKDLVEVVLYYKKNDKNNTLKVSRKMDDIPEDQKKLYVKVIFQMRLTNWKLYNDLQREALIDKGTGEGEQIDWIKYKETRLLKTLVSWDVKDKDGNKIPVNQETIFSLHPIMAEMLLNEYDRRTVLDEG